MDEEPSKRVFEAANNLRAYWEKMVRQLDAMAGKVRY
jgi:hypothetical protein